MAEMTKADIYMTYLDQILAGEKEIRHIEDLEIANLLRLAKTMIANDFSSYSKIRENLKKQLLEQLTNRYKSDLALILDRDELLENDELDEEDLSFVAAGIGQADEQRDSCPFCGSKLLKLQGKCPSCNH